MTTSLPELWGGVECTATRAGDRFVDQVRRSGHHDRIEDLDRFAALGLRAIRYPVLWERIAPDHPDRSDWSWTDARLERLRFLGIDVIAGLVHHGGGPRYTDLLDNAFAPGVARHAAAAARRYPWVRDWTPINEPVTTARFAALYGVWHPHRADEASFWRALLNEVDATRLAMRAIRRVTPGARLIQTDDLGRTYATERLAEQAAFDNTRRWMGWDLLFGRVTPAHPLWHRLCAHGLGERLRVIADDPCPPDIVGINHYLTSDRFLDHRLQRYPDDRHGGNGRDAYADLEPVRALDPAPDGFATAIRDAWERYRTPISITEVHNGCTREEQMRWAADAWAAAGAARARGIDVRAVTAWALLGSHDWDRLLTEEGAYEPGLFDVSGGTVRETALAALWRDLAAGSLPEVARAPGWWRRPARMLHPATARAAPVSEQPMAAEPRRPILILGAAGTLGRALQGACAGRGIAVAMAGRAELDLCDPDAAAPALARLEPWAVVNAAGWARADGDQRRLGRIDGSVVLARRCAALGIPLVQLSSDLVFAGVDPGGYDEAAVPAPASAVGRAEHAAEQGALAAGGACLIVRTAGLFAAEDRSGLVAAVLRTLRGGDTVEAAADCARSFAFAPTLAHALLDGLIDGETGIRHLVHDDAVSQAEFARRLARAAGFDPARVRATDALGPGRSAPLRSGRGPMLGSLDAAIAAVGAALPTGRAPAPAILQECVL